MCFFRLIISILFCALANLVWAKAPIFTDKDFYNHPPRIIRTCCALGTDLKVSIVPIYRYTMLTSPELLGSHHYLGSKEERNGILYTRRGGFLDFGHMRDLVDWTAYLYNLGKKSQKEGEFYIRLGFESGEKALVIKVPPNETDQDLINLAGKIAYDLSIWHEITSWFGASAVPLVPERFSSFSPEDAFSNLIGVKIATEAIGSELPFEEAVTQIINRTLKELEAVATIQESYDAMEVVRDIWWTRKKRLPNNQVTIQRELGVYSPMKPWLVPGWEPKNPLPFELMITDKTMDGIPFSEFYTLTFDLNRKIPVKKIFPDRVQRMVTQNDFDKIIEYVGKSMVKSRLLIRM
jgi:hypothetical protein